jgi:hypothetical protein
MHDPGMPQPNIEDTAPPPPVGAVVMCVLSGDAAARVIDVARKLGKTPQQVIVAAVTALQER